MLRIDAFELWYWRRLLRYPWTARRSNQSILKEISPELIGRTDVEAKTPILCETTYQVYAIIGVGRGVRNYWVGQKVHSGFS